MDRIIPDVPVRQWVLSPPYALSYLVAYDSRLLAALIRIFIRAIFSSLRRRARACGIPHGECGAVAFVQRFGSGLNLHPHVHVLVLDGVFSGLEGEHPRFYPLRPPDDSEVAALAGAVSRRTQALLAKKGISASGDGEDDDPLMRDTPWLAGLYASGVRGRIAPPAPTPESAAPPGEAAEKRRSRDHPPGVAPTSMDSVSMPMSACLHIDDKSWNICAVICCGPHWLSSAWSVFPAAAWRIG